MPFHIKTARKFQSLRLKLGAGKLRALKRQRERQEALAFQRELQAKEQVKIAKARATAPRRPSTTVRLLKATGKATFKGLDKLTKPKPVRRGVRRRSTKAYDDIYGFGETPRRTAPTRQRLKRGRRGSDEMFDMPDY